MMSRPSPMQAEYMQKEAVIQSLKKQLYQLKDREHDLLPLQNEVSNVESKYELLQAEKERLESEYKLKLEINRKNILELRTEADSLRMHSHKAAVQIEEALRDIASLKRTCETRQTEIAALVAAGQEMNSKNEHLGEENKNASARTKELKEERNLLDKQAERLLRGVEDSLSLLKGLEKDGRGFEASNNKLKSILAVAEKDNLELQADSHSREQVLAATFHKLDHLNHEIDGLKDKLLRITRELGKGEQDYCAVAENLELLAGRTKEQGRKIKLLENELRLLENDYDAALLDRDGLYNDHQVFSHQNKLLNDDIDRMLLAVMEAQSSNQQLQQELSNYVALDEEARRLLNRRDNMLGLMDSTSLRLAETANHISHLR